jgi:hypothetical protein
MAKKRPIAEETIDGLRVRCFTGRTFYTCIVGDKDFEDGTADAWEFDKVFGISTSMAQAAANFKREQNHG